jgi:hypothetical protein
MQLFARPGEAHVEQAALFLETAGLMSAHSVGEQILFRPR